MNYSVEYHRKVVEIDIPKLDQMIRLRIKAAIEQKLMTRPDIFGIPLRHSTQGHRKLRVGDYRVVFRLEGARVKVLIIEHRSVIYKMMINRI